MMDNISIPEITVSDSSTNNALPMDDGLPSVKMDDENLPPEAVEVKQKKYITMPYGKISLTHDYTKFVLQINGKLSLLFNRRKKEPLSIVNPFIYIWNIPYIHWVKMCILTIILLPIRIFFFSIFFLLSVFISYIATTSLDYTKPMIGWRKKFMLPIFIGAARTAFFFGGFHWINVKGQRCSKEMVPILVIAPHSAFMDALIVVYLGMNSVVGKLETANSSIGCLLKMTQPVLVDRDNPDSRQKTIDEIHRRCSLLEDWPQMLIFPEGTCTNRSGLINFKTGAFMCGLPVQPVVLRWSNTVDNTTWTWEGPGIWVLLWMTFTQFYSKVEVEFLPPYFPSAEEKSNPVLFANSVRSIMASNLQIPTINYSYEDCRHMTLAKENGLPFSEIVVEFRKITNILISSYGDEEEMLKKLISTIHSSSSKRITLMDFCSKFLVPEAYVPMVESIFKYYDKSKKGSILLHEFVAHLALYSLCNNRKKGFSYACQAFKESTNLDDCDVYNETLRHVFLLSMEDVNELFTVIQARNENGVINLDTIDDVMQIIVDPFNMYKDYFYQYSWSKKSSNNSSEPSRVPVRV